MTGKSRTSGGSQWNTCGGNTLDEKTRPKNAPSSMEMTPKWPIWSQNCRLCFELLIGMEKREVCKSKISVLGLK